MEDNGFSVQAVTAAIAGDKEGFMRAFNDAIAGKVTDALEVKKVEIASSLLTPGTENNEVQGNEIEVGGSSSDAVDSTTAEA